MDKKQKLTDIVKNAKLPLEVETYLVGDIEKHEPLTDEYILEVSDMLDRLGAYFKTAADTQNAYLDRLEEESAKVNDAMEVLNSIMDDSGDGNKPPASNA